MSSMAVCAADAYSRRSSHAGLLCVAIETLLLAAMSGVPAVSAELPTAPGPIEAPALDHNPPESVWRDLPGEGYRSTTQTVSLEAGVAYGPSMMGSRDQHHLVLLSAAYGQMFSPVQGDGHWWRGNFEGRLELFGGVQFAPEVDWLVGITPHLRYNLATGSRFTPFIDAGVGFSLTGIGSPDLGSLFEFNLQGAMGVHWHVQDELALTFEARYIHLSNSGISDMNYGLNAVVAMLGVTRFF